MDYCKGGTMNKTYKKNADYINLVMGYLITSGADSMKGKTIDEILEAIGGSRSALYRVIKNYAAIRKTEYSYWPAQYWLDQTKLTTGLIVPPEPKPAVAVNPPVREWWPRLLLAIKEVDRMVNEDLTRKELEQLLTFANSMKTRLENALATDQWRELIRDNGEKEEAN